MADHTPSRHEKSLGLLTTKFVSLLQEAKDGVLDLKVVSIPTLLTKAPALLCSISPADGCQHDGCIVCVKLDPKVCFVR